MYIYIYLYTHTNICNLLQLRQHDIGIQTHTNQQDIVISGQPQINLHIDGRKSYQEHSLGK